MAMVIVMVLELFQFTPLREGRRSLYSSPFLLMLISIHAPAGGATGDIPRKDIARTYFNSRPCGRGDPVTCSRLKNKLISIHAPAGGATSVLFPFLAHAYFNSRPCGRGDKVGAMQSACRWQFQFTPLREGRLSGLRQPAIIHLFQFTPLREGRLPSGAMCGATQLFQFTPLREGRPWSM